MADEPTSQKKVETGDAIHNSGRPGSTSAHCVVFVKTEELTDDEECDV